MIPASAAMARKVHRIGPSAPSYGGREVSHEAKLLWLTYLVAKRRAASHSHRNQTTAFMRWAAVTKQVVSSERCQGLNVARDHFDSSSLVLCGDSMGRSEL